MSQTFEVEKTCPRTGARAGVIITSHGLVPTPVFMPVGSQATVKALTPDDLRDVGATIVLSNAYHLYLRPGVHVIEKMGGLHRFMGWSGPMLTDSGGYQIFSLASLRRVDDRGVIFRSHIDGSEHSLTPEDAIELQRRMGADIIMVLDECPPYTKDVGQVRQAMERTHKWAERCRRVARDEEQQVFGIVQGGVFADLRRESSEYLTSLDFAGYAIGGLSLGEGKEETLAMVEETVACLPAAKPRYLMGVGSPEDLVENVARGVDLFDSALPTRTARNGALFTDKGRLNIRNARYRELDEAIEPGCDCYTCQRFSVAYLNHLFRSSELLAYRLATIHNLRFVMRLMGRMRQAIVEGGFGDFREGFLAEYRTTDEDVRLAQKQRWLERAVRVRDECDSTEEP
ncbi:MAG: tRNA guanosine(34) transglycosylase Tgt [Dehalococcoidia bacterium]|nr:tRNA guanosine(34) transglycosylase Tgt [Dehalococcoidia bacterium]